MHVLDDAVVQVTPDALALALLGECAHLGVQPRVGHRQGRTRGHDVAEHGTRLTLLQRGNG
jgi:hypothetical protein